MLTRLISPITSQYIHSIRPLGPTPDTDTLSRVHYIPGKTEAREPKGRRSRSPAGHTPGLGVCERQPIAVALALAH